MESPARTRELSALDETWARVDGYLRSRLRPDLYERWFAPLRASAIDDGRLHVAAPDKFHRDFVDDNYRPWFEEFLPAVTGTALRVVFVVDDRPRAAAAHEATPAPAAPARPATTRPSAAPASATPSRPSWSASRTASPSPPRRRWPRSPATPGTRSSSTATPASARPTCSTPSATPSSPPAPGGPVAVVTSERYTNDFVDALRKGTLDEFRRRYRECAALLIDDVQFFAGKDKTAEEFFHTFNTLYEQGVQIVLSSDRSPKELKGLEERLCSRFEWGMRVQIDVPEFETRAAILKKKAELEQIDLPDEVATLLATHIRSNVRELHGALTKLSAFASLKAEPISVRLARDVLSDVIPPPGYKPTIERIQEATAAHYGLTVAKLTSASREQKIAIPRQVAMFLCRELAKETFQLIAEKFNKKDHSTVISAKERVEELLGQDPEIQTAVATLTQKLAP